MGIGLMADIEDYLVIRSIVDIVKAHYQLYGTETGTEVSRIRGTTLYHVVPDFGAQLFQFLQTHPFQVRREIDFVELSVHYIHFIELM